MLTRNSVTSNIFMDVDVRVIDADYFFASRQQLIDEMGPNETGTSRH
jgi:hypothetical protein